MWVGLSAVKVDDIDKETPLSNLTNSGKLISEVEQLNREVDFYKTNLVKCLPIQSDKIRYPNKEEMRACYNNLECEVNDFKPKIVFLLGKLVADFVAKDKFDVSFADNFKYQPVEVDGTLYVPIHHPSYILVYKRKKVNSYMKGISKVIGKYLA